MSLPIVGVVLVNYNGMKFLPKCVETILANDHSEIKLVIVDNCSTDGSREWLQKQSSNIEVILLSTNTGITGGNNAGIRRSLELGCDEVFILNNDTELLPGTIRLLVAARETNRILIPRIYFFDHPTVLNNNFGSFDYLRGRSNHMFYGQPDSTASNQAQLGTMSSTCALMVPRIVFEQIGLMDENYFIYYDDTDFVARAVKAGYLVKYVPDSILFHKESLSSGGNRMGPLPLFYLTRNRLYFMRKHQPNRIMHAVFSLYFRFTQTVHLVQFVLKQDRDSILAIKMGIRCFRDGQMGYVEPEHYRISVQ